MVVLNTTLDSRLPSQLFSWFQFIRFELSFQWESVFRTNDREKESSYSKKYRFHFVAMCLPTRTIFNDLFDALSYSSFCAGCHHRLRWNFCRAIKLKMNGEHVPPKNVFRQNSTHHPSSSSSECQLTLARYPGERRASEWHCVYIVCKFVFQLGDQCHSGQSRSELLMGEKFE